MPVLIPPSDSAGELSVVVPTDAPSPESLGRDKRAVYIRTIVGIVLGIIRSIALGRLLLPEAVSAYRLSTVWAGYFGLVSLGTADALHFLGPSLARRRETKDLGTLRGVALTMSLLAALSALAGVTALTLHLRLAGPGTAFALGLLAFLTTLTPYLNIELWVAGQFHRQARVELTGAIVGTGASLAGLAAAGLPGFVIGNVIGAITAFFMARDAFALGQLLPRTLPQYWRSIQFGFGQTVLVLTQGAVVSADIQMLAFSPLGRARLGLYSFASMLAVAIRTAATAGAIVSQTVFLASHRALPGANAASDEIEELRRIDTSLATILSIGALCVVTALAPTMFPRYRGVVEPLAGMTIAISTLRWGFFHAVALSSRRQQWRTIPLALLGIAVTAAWTYAAVRLDWGMVRLSLAPAVGAATYSVATVVLHERTVAGEWGWKSIRHMCLFSMAELPLLALRTERSWVENTLIAAGSLLLTVLMLAAFDRKTSASMGALVSSMLAPGRSAKAPGAPGT